MIHLYSTLHGDGCDGFGCWEYFYWARALACGTELLLAVYLGTRPDVRQAQTLAEGHSSLSLIFHAAKVR